MCLQLWFSPAALVTTNCDWPTAIAGQRFTILQEYGIIIHPGSVLMIRFVLIRFSALYSCCTWQILKTWSTPERIPEDKPLCCFCVCFIRSIPSVQIVTVSLSNILMNQKFHYMTYDYIWFHYMTYDYIWFHCMCVCVCIYYYVWYDPKRLKLPS